METERETVEMFSHFIGQIRCSLSYSKPHNISLTFTYIVPQKVCAKSLIAFKEAKLKQKMFFHDNHRRAHSFAPLHENSGFELAICFRFVRTKSHKHDEEITNSIDM